MQLKCKNLTVGYMLQEDSLFPWLNILDNSLLGLKIQKQLTKEKKETVLKLLETYGLKDFTKILNLLKSLFR